MKKRLLTSLAVLLSSLLTSFAQFSGSGSGTKNDPYLIMNPIQLNQLRNFLNQSGVYFKLMSDIDLTDFLEDENPSRGWQPVGSSSAAFKGIVDGNGKTVSGLWINRASTDYVGFFANTDKATIKDLKIVATTISGKDNIGGMSGYSQGSTFSGCSFTGSIMGGTCIGGYIGSGGGGITLSNNIAVVDVTGTGDNIGGYIGKNDGSLSVSNCVLNDGKITGENHVGGCLGTIVGNQVEKTITGTCIYADIIGENYVGGICGDSQSINFNVNLNTCGFVGNIYATQYVGGLIGYIAFLSQWGTDNDRRSIQEKCYVIGSVCATKSYAGGLIGYDSGYARRETGSYGYQVTNYNNIIDSYFCGMISGKDYSAGLVGYKQYGAISNCYSAASVAGDNYVGGLVGYNSDNAVRSYAGSGRVMFYDNRSTIKNSVAINTRVSAKSGPVNRIVGYNAGNIAAVGSTEENKSYNRTIVVSQGVAKDVEDDAMNGTGVSLTTLKLKATYVAMGFDFTNTWDIQETECLPYMKCQTAPPVITSSVKSGATVISGKCVDGGIVTLEMDGVKQQTVSNNNTFSFDVSPLHSGHEIRVSARAEGKEASCYTTELVSFLGKGTMDDPYQVYTAADLTGVYRKGYFKLMNDIDLTGYINQFSPNEGWQSIGSDGSEAIHFDGGGYKITGLWCNSTRNNTGLFSCFSNGVIKNLTIETAVGKQVKGGANTGILIGKMISGTIENCRVAGTVADGTPVGGIAGLLKGGQILRSQANVTINTVGEKSYVGGLVGVITDGMIEQCVSLGSLNATGTESYVGGLVGKNSATVINCYSNAQVTSSYNAAGVVAYNYGIVDKCYATGDLYSNNYAAGVIGYNDGANAIVRNCAAMNNKIEVKNESQSAQGGGYGQRIIGGLKNGAQAPELNNYALKNMLVYLIDVPQIVYDDIMNGVAKSDADLKSAQTYQELGWDFDDVWGIHSAVNDGYPYLRVFKPAIATTAPAAVEDLVYTGEDQTLITAGVAEGGELKYSLDGETYTATLPTGINAGDYTVYYKVIADAEHTDMAAQTLTATIAKAPLTIKAESYTKKQYDPMPEFSVSYDGFKNGETKTAMSKQPVLNCTANVDSEPGEYTITVSGAEAKNYTIQYVAGKLTVTEPDSYKLTYMVDGKEYQSSMVKYKGTITPLTEPTKEGYTFSGWSEIPETMPARDVTVTGTFTINSYTVTFQYGDVVLTTTKVEYGAVIPLPESLDSDRYTLVEWLDVPATMPARDITIYADFTDGVKAVQGNTLNAEYYRLNGVKHEKLQRGVNILRMNDGTTRKVLVK